MREERKTAEQDKGKSFMHIYLSQVISPVR